MTDTDKLFLPPQGAEVNIIPVMQGEGLPKVDEKDLPDNLPILALRNAVLFPGSIYPITIGREKSIRLISDAEKHNMFVGTVPQNDLSVEDPHIEDMYPYGTVARVMKTLEMPDGTITAIMQGLRRFHLDEILDYEPYMYGRVSYRTDITADNDSREAKVIADAIKDRTASLMKMGGFIPKETVNAIRSIDDLEFLTNFIATTVETENYAEKIALLSEDDILRRAMALLKQLDNQLELMKIKQDINAKVKSEIDQQQREYYLNNQLKTIQEELGMDDVEEFDRLRKRELKRKSGPRRSRRFSIRNCPSLSATTRLPRTTAYSTITWSLCSTCPGVTSPRTTWTSGTPRRCSTRTTTGWTR